MRRTEPGPPAESVERMRGNGWGPWEGAAGEVGARGLEGEVSWERGKDPRRRVWPILQTSTVQTTGFNALFVVWTQAHSGQPTATAGEWGRWKPQQGISSHILLHLFYWLEKSWEQIQLKLHLLIPINSCTYETLSCELSKDANVHSSNVRHEWHCSLPSISCLLTVLQLYHLPLPLPPPVSNSSCLFTRCQPRYASCCTVLLYCKIKKCFLYFVFVLYELFVWKVL